MRMSLIIAAVLTVMVSGLPVAQAASAPASLRWEDVFDGGNGDGATGVARGGREVIAIGRSSNALGAAGFHVRATDASTGALLWDDHVEFPGGLVRALEVAIHGAGAYVVGEGTDAAGSHVLLVRAYRRTTGALLWEDRSMVGGPIGLGQGIAADGVRVYVSGHRTQAAGGRDMLVRALDAKTGALVWEDVFDRGGDDVAADVAVHGGRVFVCGASGVAPFPVHTDFAMRALDARTGAVLWEDFYDFDGHLDQAREIAVSGGRVYATGFGRHPGADDDIVVRAYDAGTGAVRWTDTFDRGGNSDFAPSIAALGPRVFIAGWAGDASGNLDALVRAYDGESGALLWMDISETPGNWNWARDVAAHGDRLYVVGQVGSAGDFDASVKSYDAQSGALVWEDRFGSPGTNDVATGLAIGQALYVAGVLRSPFTPDWTVRAYDLHGAP